MNEEKYCKTDIFKGFGKFINAKSYFDKETHCYFIQLYYGNAVTDDINKVTDKIKDKLLTICTRKLINFSIRRVRIIFESDTGNRFREFTVAPCDSVPVSENAACNTGTNSSTATRQSSKSDTADKQICKKRGKPISAEPPVNNITANATKTGHVSLEINSVDIDKGITVKEESEDKAIQVSQPKESKNDKALLKLQKDLEMQLLEIKSMQQLCDKNSIVDNRVIDTDENGNTFYHVKLTQYGKNNTQIFTRQSDIDDMIEHIGKEIVLDVSRNILEPASGDGAFTTRILQLRLEKIRNEANTVEDYVIASLKALATIYSIEYEPDTALTQRCNLYTMMYLEYEKFWAKINPDTKIQYYNTWDSCMREIIFNNVMWGEFASTGHPKYNMFNEHIIGFDRGSGRALTIIKWNPHFDKSKKKKILL